ncbi:hypothetical protein [Pseudocnuella soli]|uniref:hypothetical protein n=1 Tax=Pseudocnuella soli TaxID=2502779 RepID=UPI00104ADF1A|nr:hypothetical protein [Pseudocnuella soli]
MFRVEKAPYEMEVMVKDETVRIRPGKKYLNLVGRTLARCEEFLAQQFFKQHNVADKYRLMQAYFESRGWQVSA